MKPVLEHSDQVVARVVAWHNQHPLARRISAHQVHSVGVVSLPFAVHGAVAGPVAEGVPSEAADAATAAVPAGTVDADAGLAPVVPAAPGAEPAEPAALPTTGGPAADEDVEAVIELVVDSPTDAPADTPEASAADGQKSADEPPRTILDRALEDQGPEPGAAEAVATELSAARADGAAGASGGSPVGTRDDRPGVAPPATMPTLPARLAPWHPRGWWARLRGQPVYRALFSEDFIAPMRPARVARWVAAHGVSVRPLAPHDPVRQIALDPARRRAGDAALEVDLHVITAAIGVDDRRHRLLLTPDGRVLGRRDWDRGRVLASAGMGLASLFGVGVGLGLASWLGLGGAGAHPAGRIEAAASAAVQAASTPAPAAVDTVGAGVHSAAVQASSPSAAPAVAQVRPAASDAAGLHAQAAALRPVVPEDVHAAARPTGDHPGSVGDAVVAGPDGAGGQAVAEPAVAEPAAGPAVPGASAPGAALVATAPASPASSTGDRPVSEGPKVGRVALPLVPRLPEAQRDAARVSSRAVRKDVPAEPAAPADARSWALVSRVMSNRRLSERAAAQLQAVALLQPVPMRAELMPSDGGWRAVFWPFPTAQDAEKVRLALADKGLPLAVVEF